MMRSSAALVSCGTIVGGLAVAYQLNGDICGFAFAAAFVVVLKIAATVRLKSGTDFGLLMLSRLSLEVNASVEIVLFLLNSVALRDHPPDAWSPFFLLSHSLGVLLTCAVVAYLLEVCVSRPASAAATALAVLAGMYVRRDGGAAVPGSG
eukprot:CAMPEP_0179217936 /NCGR_PEP_ID=MMETSP0797-20121207/4189_1 /TAXON_ID=47934 /ORGANISM="Dinophysis acuminata, Strain DAEP01" /LENGTH=149 /DNA_ID=CAMNT_0020924217 /DNA_START=83 /DNA_END=529 /DNA_ORIENTATION=+